jgi:ferric-dicitrate binding protein FerR (iron transport regulator)
VQVVGTRFQVTSLPSCTVVAVEEGKVQVTDAEGRSDAVASGERRTFCAPPAKIAMDDEPGTEQIREALVLVSSGKDLERAARMLAEYREQHPDGVFAEEALFHLCVIDLRLSRVQQAAELSEAFARRFPNSPRARTLADLVRRAREASPSTDLR